MLAVVTLFATSCSDYLDVNANQNKPTSVTANLILSQALVGTALVMNQYNTYGMQIGGYAANAGGFGGFNETTTYIYTNNNYNNLWPASYDNLEDYQYIIDQTQDAETGAVDPQQIYFNAIARIMKSFGFQMVVDAYGDAPYTEAFKGEGNLTPGYDAASKIYAAIAADIDKAIADIKTGQTATIAPTAVGSYDVVYHGDMNAWIKLANTIKLRLLIRGNGKVDFANKTLDASGFITTDAIINPGYTRDVNRQNPNWNSWAFGYTGASATKAWIPTDYVMGFYDNHKLNDPGRGGAIYYQFFKAGGTGTNQLGYEGVGIPKSPDGNFWYPAVIRGGTDGNDTTGVLKGPSAGMVMLSAAESYFLQSEAALENIAAGDVQVLFEDGIHASFEYLYEPQSNAVKDSMGTPNIDANNYIKSNNTYLTQINMAGSNDQKLEAIITQKWIALNMINSWEGYNEYRRTGYPKSSGSNPVNSFASAESLISARPDRLPTRILYPTSEIQYNGGNVPGNINSQTSLIFWAK